MYCRMCGNKLGDTDRFCQFCGTSTGYPEPPAIPAEKTEIKEEVVFNPPYENKSRFAEEEFISDHEVEAAQEENEDDAAGTEPAKNSEFTWNVYEFPTAKKKTENIEFNWNMEDHGQTEQKDAEAAAFEEELFREIRDDASRIKEQNIDRFFTFSRKNEEFQELLDKEYDKIKMRSVPFREPGITEAVPLLELHIEDKAQEAEVQEAEIQETEVQEAGAQETDVQDAEAQETDVQDAEAQETEIPPIEGPVEEEPQTEEATPAVEEPQTEEEQPAVEEPQTEPGEIPKAEHLSEMAQARAQYFGDELIRDNESIRKKLLSSGRPEEANSNEEPSSSEKSMEDYIKEEKEAEHYIENQEPEQDEEDDIDRRAESVAAAYAAAAAEQPAGPVSDNPSIPVFYGTEGEEKEETHKGRTGQIVLIIISIILAAEIIILGIRYFAPDSAAAKAVGSAQTGIYNAITGLTGSISDLFTGNSSNDSTTAPEDSENDTADGTQDNQSAGQEQTDDGTTVPAPDPNPMADKDALVASQMGNNINIEQVKANAALAYQSGKNYGLSDINQSKPIANNIWLAPESGDPVYYDKSVVGAVIAFDSQWIDYVNGSSRSILDLLKKDSEAYRKTLNYSKIGKVKETFELLEIGEIRQGAKGFYVWVHEEISITEKGTAANKGYNWIYYLEPADGKMQIVNYFKF